MDSLGPIDWLEKSTGEHESHGLHRKQLERATEKAKNESLESIYDDVMEFQRTGLMIQCT